MSRWPPRSKSARLQVLASPSVMFDRTVKFVRAWIFADNIHASCLQAKGRRRHLSQNIGPAVAGSAGPVPPSLPFILLSTCEIKIQFWIVNPTFQSTARSYWKVYAYVHRVICRVRLTLSMPVYISSPCEYYSTRRSICICLCAWGGKPNHMGN